jgi:hypothetical protein|tara:strand:- start:329 stop:577 length:249 start_codon:yes stop_codon:yes gene_type:complete
MEPLYVPVDKVAKHFSVSIATMRSWVGKGRISSDAYINVDGLYRYNIAKVEASLLGDVATEVDELTPDTVYEQLELDLDDDF